MTKYNLSFTSASALFVVIYSNGQFKRLERKKGTLKQEQWATLCKIIPTDEHHIKDVVEKYQGRIIYEQQSEEKVNEHQQFKTVYVDFYNDKNGFNPKLDGAEINALKAIISYLKDISFTPTEALAVWKQLFSNWNKLDPFYQSKMQLKQINSSLSTLLTELKNGNTKSNKKRDADELRQSL